MAVSALPPDSMLAWPLQPTRIGWLIGLSLAALIPKAFTGVIEFHFLPSFSVEGDPASVFSLMLGLLLEGVLAMLSLRLAVEGFLSASSGRVHEQDRHQRVDDGQAFRQLLFWSGVLVLAYFTGLFAGTGALVLLGLGLVFALPAILSLLVLDDSLRRALNPLAWFEMFQRSGPSYVLMAAKLGLLAALAIAACLLLDSSLPRWPAAAIARLPVLYAMLAGYYGLGRMLDAQRGDFELAREAELPRPKLASVEEDSLMREVDILAIEEKPAEAAALLSRLIRGRGASAPIHARYRDLLRQAGDTEALLQHGRDYVAVLLALGQDRPALSLYLASLEIDPAFQMAEPAEVSRLIAIAARGGQSQLAVKLAAEFDARFPRDRERIDHALTAARLLATRLDRSSEARLLLQQLIVALPEHPRLDEIETALREFSAN